jgi:hypothetical protein
MIRQSAVRLQQFMGTISVVSSGARAKHLQRQERTAASHMRVRHDSCFRQMSCKSLLLVLPSCQGPVTASQSDSNGCAGRPMVLTLRRGELLWFASVYLPFSTAIPTSHLRFRRGRSCSKRGTELRVAKLPCRIFETVWFKERMRRLLRRIPPHAFYFPCCEFGVSKNLSNS